VTIFMGSSSIRSSDESAMPWPRISSPWRNHLC
jgi:hypothetical protein